MSATFPFTVGDKVRRAGWCGQFVTIAHVGAHGSFLARHGTGLELERWSKAANTDGGWVAA